MWACTTSVVLECAITRPRGWTQSIWTRTASARSIALLYLHLEKFSRIIKILNFELQKIIVEKASKQKLLSFPSRSTENKCFLQ